MSRKFSLNLVKRYLNAAGCNVQCFFFDEIDSTQNAAKKYIKETGSANSFFATDNQTNGYGRNARAWLSTHGKSLVFSLLLSPVLCPEKLPLANYAAGLAVKQVLLSYNIRTELKWPNDILLNGRKLCGIFSESAALRNTRFYLITGFGLNINHNFEDFPDEIRDSAASLKIACGKEFCREQLAAEIVIEYLRLVSLLEQNHETILNIYKENCGTLGKTVKLIFDNYEIVGIAKDINPDGSIAINKNGEKLSFFAADIVHLRNV